MEAYNWIKALHIIAVISWMAGMLYLPRLYVYHSNVAVGSEPSELFKVMERRLLRAIINPAMIATFLLGFALIWVGGGQSWAGALDWIKASPWMHAKLTLVFVLSAVHGFMAGIRKKFLRDERPYSAKFFRFLNEVPTLLMIIIVILVVVKPF